MKIFLKNTNFDLCLQVHKPVQELLHRKKCLLADDPELAAAPADGKYYDGDVDECGKGKAPFQKRAVFLNIFQKAFCPPPLLFEHLSYFAGGVFSCGEFFK